jgi:hypothetical protein
MKNIYFLCGMPRAGNTLLGSLLNQDKEVKLTANTILIDIFYKLLEIKKTEIFNNFPDHKSLDNIIKNVFNNYYKNWKTINVIDRGPWGTPANLNLLKQLIKNRKFIILYRPVLECLASFIRIEKPFSVEKRCEQLMSKEGMIGKNLWSIKNIIDEKEKYIIINYNDLIKNTEKEIKKIYSFLKIKFNKFKSSDFNDFEINNIKYNDSIYNVNLHEVRTDEIKLNKYKITEYLSKNIIKKYSNLDI